MLYLWMKGHEQCRDVFINLGGVYQPAIAGFWEWSIARGIHLTMATGGIGTRCGELREWLGAGA